MKHLSLKTQGELLYIIGPNNEPRLKVKAGETIAVETHDAWAGRIRNEKQTYSSVLADLGKYGNPVSGPIYVEDAAKGDTLVVDIRGIRPTRSYAITVLPSWWWYLSNPGTAGLNRMLNPQQPERIKFCEIKDDKVCWDKETVLSYLPQIGTIGTAPELEAIPSTTLGSHGGNMDLPEIGPGTKLYLPVYVKGALLHIGDVHAAQGEAEICGSGMEITSEVTITIDTIKGKSINWPRYETPEYLAGVASSCAGTTLEDAIRLAFIELVEWLHRDYGFDKWEAYHLLTFVGKVSLGNMWCAAAKFPKVYLRKRQLTIPKRPAS
jgi:acetamidase/formamidase